MAAADTTHFDRVIDYLHERRGDEVSLQDVVALAEITAESFNAFFQSVDSILYRELREIASYIVKMRREIGALQAHDLKAKRIPDAGRELDLIVQATAEATNGIMECAEAIMGADASDPVAYKAFVDDRMMQIFEACSFQDLTGQRVKKVVETLTHIETRVSRFAAAINTPDAAGPANETEGQREARARALLLNGPQAKSEAACQDDIDAMFP